MDEIKDSFIWDKTVQEFQQVQKQHSIDATELV
jgi:hypothetical protein